jgi:hypothetical protein
MEIFPPPPRQFAQAEAAVRASSPPPLRSPAPIQLHDAEIESSLDLPGPPPSRDPRFSSPLLLSHCQCTAGEKAQQLALSIKRIHTHFSRPLEEAAPFDDQVRPVLHAQGYVWFTPLDQVQQKPITPVTVTSLKVGRAGERSFAVREPLVDLAQLLHTKVPAVKVPFRTVNAAAIPEETQSTYHQLYSVRAKRPPNVAEQLELLVRETHPDSEYLRDLDFTHANAKKRLFNLNDRSVFRTHALNQDEFHRHPLSLRTTSTSISSSSTPASCT